MTDKTKVIIKGQVVRKKYCVQDNMLNLRFYAKPYIREATELAGYKTFYECEIEGSPFTMNEDIYISKLDIEVSIDRIARSTDGEYIYYTDFVMDIINDKETEESKNSAEENLSKLMKLYEVYIK